MARRKSAGSPMACSMHDVAPCLPSVVLASLAAARRSGAPPPSVARYEAHKQDPDFDLEGFVTAHFTLPQATGVTPPAGLSLAEHINWLWPELARTTTTAPRWSSLIALPKTYVVPGGRFREIYYWD